MQQVLGHGDELPFAIEEGGVRLAVRVTPRAKINELDGVLKGSDGRSALQMRLAARPIEGAANKALIDFVSASLKLRKSNVKIRSGETARLKILHLAGDSAKILAKVIAWVGVEKPAG